MESNKQNENSIFEEVIITFTQAERKALYEFANSIGCTLSSTIRGFVTYSAPQIKEKNELVKIIEIIKRLDLIKKLQKDLENHG